MYCSNSEDKIFQSNPVWHVPSQFKPKGWCDTVEGYLREAKKLTTLLVRNRKLMKAPYVWFLTIYVDFHQSPNEISSWWNKAKRNLTRKGLDAIWIREPTRSNKAHYHLLVKNRISKMDMARIIEESLPSRELGRWHKGIRLIDPEDEWHLLNYFSKAKIEGKNKAGKYFADLYGHKRLLFVKNLRIRKLGTIGNFWVKSKTVLWKEVIEQEKRIAEGLEKPNVKRLCRYVHEYLGGFVPLEKIERSYAYWSDSDGVQHWIQSLLTDEWAEEDAADNG